MSIIDYLFPPDSVSEVREKMLKYGRNNPDKSELQIIEEFSGSMSRAKKAEAKEALKNMPLPKSKPTKEEKIVAQVRVRETFKISKIGTIAGAYVEEGKITRNTMIRVIRDGIVVFPMKEGAIGELSSLKRFKDDVKEVKFGFECGLTIKGFNDLKVDDVIEGYEIVEVKQRLK